MSLDFGEKKVALRLLDDRWCCYLAGVLSGNSMPHRSKFWMANHVQGIALVAFISSAVAALSMWHQHQRNIALALHSGTI